MTDRLTDMLVDLARSGKPVTVILMRLMMEGDSEHRARQALDAAASVADRAAAERLQSVAALWAAHPQAYATLRATVAGLDDPEKGSGRSFGVADWAKAFDRVVDVSPEASVAAYSLGDPVLLASATEEVCACMDAWGLLDPAYDGLDLGCGIGRFLVALAPRLRSMVGIDISAGMVGKARLRCAGLNNVEILQGTGIGLQSVADRSVDFVLAADVFPYLVDVGGGLDRLHVEEGARVLRSGGYMLILNYAYTGTDPEQSATVSSLAHKAALAVVKAGERPFRLWDASVHLLRQTR